MPLKQMSTSLVMLLGAGALILVGFGLLALGQTTALAAAVAFSVLVVVFRVSRTLGLYLGLVYLILLGDIRRISALINGFSTNDPLILVGPAFVLLVAVPLFIEVRLRDTPSKLVLALSTLMLLGMFNPGQGGFAVGLAGAVISLPPLLWFWVGRNYGSEAMIRTVAYRILVPLALLACLLGLYQTFAGPAFWQQAWVDYKISTHFDVLRFGLGGIRAFGFSTVTSEYTNLILMASLFCGIAALSGRRVLLLPLILLLPTLFLSSQRGAIFRLLIGWAVGYSFKSRNPATLPIRMAFSLLVGFGGLSLALSQHGDIAQTRGASTEQAAVAHQVNGLAHPFDQRYSTGGMHATEVFVGFLRAFQHPIGFGIGAASVASKFSSADVQLGSEFDISDMFLKLGLPGGLTFIFLIAVTMFTGYRYTKFGPKDTSLPIFAMMFAFIGSWSFQGEYGNGPLFFVLLGSMVRIVDQREPASRTGKSRLSGARAASARISTSALDPIPTRVGSGGTQTAPLTP